ncbi:MAG: hypothetical protein COU81_00275 [Candidatus Portnoybacteria bacterium CG10_big_fil_rev_8_21_14_0_10_36_7]|uniref:Uncharacterized protein n=1 Tax=Candidatus Portnoybacteria bacterium CG10_big_fil_rev_8_21_14_0_10_36_7 TaxID=1974812 RepID=A0A2M8KF29_9BACT|nr:MAG: hypothetical protein COU81_00275 [Candidatus Portnoybacteria bacterium CG10_big_fil_rev_8_21_14_0_10_36_7]
MNKFIFSIIIIGSWFVLGAGILMPNNISAESDTSILEGSAIKKPRIIKQQALETIKEVRSELKDEVKSQKNEKEKTTELIKEEAKSELKALTLQDKKNYEEKREEAKQKIEIERKKFKNKLEQARQEAKEKIELKREELKAKLENFRDARKKKLTENIAEQLNNLNARLVAHFTNTTNKIEEVLDRVVSRTDKAETHDQDVTAIRIAIENARQLIESSRLAITEQTNKVYTILVSTEENIKIDVKDSRKLLHDDLKATQAIVKDAHESVKNVAVILAKIPRIDELEVDLESNIN